MTPLDTPPSPRLAGGAAWRPWRGLPTALGLVLACAALVLGLAPAEAATTAGSGRSATETRTPGAFEAIEVAGSIDVRVRQAGATVVRVTADDNLLALVETVVEPGPRGGTLKVRLRRGESVRTDSPIRVEVELPTLRAVALAGSGDLVVERFETTELGVSISGAGDATLRELSTASLSVRIAGSGNVQASGSAVHAKLSIAGSGDADLAALKADVVEVSIAGSGDADVTAERSLKVSIAGSGDVRYGGAVADVRSSVVGSGSVRAR